MTMSDIIPAGRYEVVVAAAEDRETRSEHYMRHMTLVVIGPMRNARPNVTMAEYMGGVLYAYAVDHEPAKFLWRDAVNNPRDFVVGQKFNAEVIRENLGDHGWGNRVKKMSLRDGDEMPPTREVEYKLYPPKHPAGGLPEVRGTTRRRSDMERDRDRIRETIWTFLFETAEPEAVVWPTVGGSRGHTGVVFPDAGVEGGAILMPGYARQLGAHLIRAADLHDEIQDGGR